MQTARSESLLRRVSGVALGLAALIGLALIADASVAADPERPHIITIENAAARVGEKVVIVAKITAREGFKITESYRHRIRNLSASEGLALEGEVVRGLMRDGSVVFLVGVMPKKAGTHTVTGWFRFSFHDGQQIDITSAPFEATVAATE
jgi:hypothetical protein